MAVPKRKTSKTRRDKRRASSYKLKVANFIKDKETGEFRIPHRVDLETGMYNGKKVIDVE